MQPTSIEEAKNLLAHAKHVFLVLSSDAPKDAYAAALSLLFSLETQGKQVTVAAPRLPNVEYSDLFGIDRVTDATPKAQPEIVVDNAVGNIERVSWEVKEQKLHLFLHLHPNAPSIDPQTVHVNVATPRIDAVVALGSGEKSAYPLLTDEVSPPTVVFAKGPHVSFGDVHMSDPTQPCIAASMAAFLLDAAYALPSDAAANLLTGLRVGTDNFQNPKAGAETFEMAAKLARSITVQLPTVLHSSVSTTVEPETAPSTNAMTEPSPDWLEPKIYRGTSVS